VFFVCTICAPCFFGLFCMQRHNWHKLNFLFFVFEKWRGFVFVLFKFRNVVLFSASNCFALSSFCFVFFLIAVTLWGFLISLI
jgi:hypothetical protein